MKSRRGEIATILTVAALVMFGVTALVSSLNLNKKQTTSSRASGCAANECSGGGTLCVPVGTVYYGYKCCDKGKNPAHPEWTWASNSPVSVGGLNDPGCKQLSCSGNTTKKYYQKTTSSSTNYSDAGCSTVITKTLTDYCKETGGANVTPVPLSNPLNWGVDKGGGCGSGGDNYQFGSCYQGKRCVQCQHGGQWLSYNCFENDSSCTGDVVYCDQPWSVKTCANGAHKCCDASKGLCIKSGNKPANGTENISVCLGTGADAVCDSPTEYCGGAGGSCNTGDSLVSPSKICDSAANKRCCLKKVDTTNYCTGTTYGCIPSSSTGNTNLDKCKNNNYTYSSVLSCGDSSKICCYGSTPAASDCEKNDANCGAGNSHYQGDNKFSYYKSKNCTGDKCYSISDSSNCKQSTWTEVANNYCLGEAPATSACTTDSKSCTGLEGCIGGNSNGYYISGNTTDGNLKYWVKNGNNCNNKTLDELKTDCGCKAGTGEATQCDFGGGTVVSTGKAICKNNIVYSCPAAGGTGTSISCTDKQQLCDSDSSTPTCYDRNLGKTACVDNYTQKIVNCNPTQGAVVTTFDCTNLSGWAGKGKYTTYCQPFSPWMCGYAPWMRKMDGSGGSFDGTVGDVTSVNSARQDAYCEPNADASVSFSVSLTIKNYESVKNFLSNGAICLTNNPKNDVCQQISKDELNSQGVYVKTFKFTPKDSYQWAVGYVFDISNHLYQSDITININADNLPKQGGYGLTVDGINPRN